MNESEVMFTPEEAATANKRVTIVMEINGKRRITEIETNKSVVVMSENDDETGTLCALSHYDFLANSAIMLLEQLKNEDPLLLMKTLMIFAEGTQEEDQSLRRSEIGVQSFKQ